MLRIADGTAGAIVAAARSNPKKRKSINLPVPRRGAGSEVRYSGLAFRLSLAVSLSLVAGCSVIDPFVTWEPIEATPKVTAQDLGPNLGVLEADQQSAAPLNSALTEVYYRDLDTVSLDQAMAYAGRGEAAYKNALSEHAELQSYMGLGLIPLTAAAIGLGATGGSTNAIIALGLGGAAGYGAGTWLLNKPRQAAYVAGIKALSCAQKVVKPFDIPLVDRVMFQANLDQLNEQMVAVEMQVAVVEGWIAEVDNLIVEAKARGEGPLATYADGVLVLLVNAKARVTAINTVLATSTDVYLNGGKLQREIDSAGRNLESAVDGIAAEVIEIINETQKDPQALATIIQGLGQSYATFTTVPEILQPATDTKTAGDATPTPQSAEDVDRAPLPLDPNEKLVKTVPKLNDALEDLGRQVAVMSGVRRSVASFVNAVVSTKPTATLESCGVSKESLITDLTIDPAGPFSLAGGKPGSVGFTVKGGQSPYGAELGGEKVKGLTVTQLAPFSPVVTVSSDGTAAAGKFVVNVVDGSGRATVVPIEITGSVKKKENDTAGGTSGGSSKTSDVVTAINDGLSGKGLKVKNVNFDVAAVVQSDDKTKAIVELEYKDGTPSGAITAAVLAQAIADQMPKALQVKADQIGIKDYDKLFKTIPPAAPPDPEFQKLGDEDRKSLQRVLCLTGDDVDGFWGPKTKTALEAFQTSQALEADGKLNSDTMKKVDEQTANQIAARCGS